MLNPKKLASKASTDLLESERRPRGTRRTDIAAARRKAPPLAAATEAENPETAKPALDRRLPSAEEAIVHASFEAAATPAMRRRLAAKSTIAVVLLVPSSAWVRAVKSYFENRLDKRWYVIARDGTSRLDHKASVGNRSSALFGSPPNAAFTSFFGIN
jgi:hypothetical protein